MLGDRPRIVGDVVGKRTKESIDVTAPVVGKTAEGMLHVQAFRKLDPTGAGERSVPWNASMSVAIKKGPTVVLEVKKLDPA